MIHRHVFHNDQLLSIDKVRLSPGQAGLVNGWGLFTTLRIVRGEAFAFERHWRRLEKDAAIIHLPMPYAGPRVRVQLQEVIRANKVTEGCARIYLFYNHVGFWRSDEPLPAVDLIIYTAPLPEFHQAVRLAIREHGRHAASALVGVKTISWLNNVWSVGEAQKDGFDAVNQGRTRKRLFKQTDGSRLQGPGSDALIRERRDKNERRVIAASANLRQKVQAAYAGHLHIRNDERGVFQSSRPKEIFR